MASKPCADRSQGIERRATLKTWGWRRRAWSPDGTRTESESSTAHGGPSSRREASETSSASTWCCGDWDSDTDSWPASRSVHLTSITSATAEGEPRAQAPAGGHTFESVIPCCFWYFPALSL